MHVLQTPVRFAPDIGGVESYVHSVSQSLVDRGHEVTVICANTAGYESTASIDGITVERLSTPFSVANKNVTPTLPAALWRWGDWADIVHTHLPTPWCADVSALFGTLTDKPTVLTYHNDIVGDGLAHWIATAYNATVLRLTLAAVDRILVTRESYLEESAHLSSAGPVSVVRNGVDTERFASMSVPAATRRSLGFVSDRPNLFFLSVLDEYHSYKGLTVLLDALETIAASEPPPHLVVGGDGPMRSEYEQAVRSRGLSEHVTFAGHIPDDDLVAAYNAADAFVLPSTSSAQEGFGLVALEALACETPVLTTAVVGVASALRQENAGIVVKPNDVAALADGIHAVLANNGRVSPRRGRALCEREYAWASSVDRLVDIYRDLCEDGSVG
jgi:glycosyltransferase involved in cell wall biosynthesis